MSQVLAEVDAGGAITAYYIYGLGLISRITPTNAQQFYHFNHRGDTIALTDASGNVMDSYAYDEYGKLIENTGTTENPFKFVGRYGVMDEGDNIYFMRARFYDAEVGRFLSEDPLGFGGGDWNLYAYVGGNPVCFIDSTGESFDPASVIATTIWELPAIVWNFSQQTYYTQEQVRAYFRGDYAYSHEVGKLAEESCGKVMGSYKSIVFSSWNPLKGSKHATKVFGKTGYLKWVDMRTRKGIVLKKLWTIGESKAKGKIEDKIDDFIFKIAK